MCCKSFPPDSDSPLAMPIDRNFPPATMECKEQEEAGKWKLSDVLLLEQRPVDHSIAQARRINLWNPATFMGRFRFRRWHVGRNIE
jgi:hypothetical protein